VSDEEFMKWAARYCAIFLQDVAKIAPTLGEWRLVFADDRFTYDELNNALSSIAKNAPEDRWQHLRRLTNAVRESRMIERRAELTETEKRAEQHGECTLCKGSGYVTVPNPKCINDHGQFVPYRNTGGGNGVYYECAVYCRCGLGRFLDDNQAAYWDRKAKERGRECRPMDLEKYERFNPNWRAQMAEREAFEHRLVTVEAKAKQQPREMLRIMAESMRMPALPKPTDPNTQKEKV
jgi:hypothetical protein